MESWISFVVLQGYLLWCHGSALLYCRAVCCGVLDQLCCIAGLFVVVSWISFVVPPEVIPGRMALLVTLFLVLVNIFNTVTSNTPKAEGRHMGFLKFRTFTFSGKKICTSPQNGRRGYCAKYVGTHS